MDDKKLLQNYSHFVDTLTSDESTIHSAYIARLNELHEQGCDIARLDTASQGLSAEAGEFEEIVKKIKYQGKPYDEDNIFHMQRELGDCIFYWLNACIALNIDPTDVIKMNVEKLEARYPGGSFDVEKSEIRKDGDI